MTESEKRKIRLEIKRALENKWQTVRWVTRILEDNETELEGMLHDLKESESQELKEWEKLKRFDKIEKLRQEKGFTRNTEKIDGQSAWEESKKKMKIEKSTELKSFITPGEKQEIGTSPAQMPCGGEGGGETLD